MMQNAFNVKIKLPGYHYQHLEHIIIEDDHIVGADGQIVKLNDVRQIVVQKADKLMGRERAFTLMVGKDVGNLSPIEIMARNGDERDEILLGIFAKFPPTEINQRHWNTVLDATGDVVVDIDHLVPSGMDMLSKPAERASDERINRNSRVIDPSKYATAPDAFIVKAQLLGQHQHTECIVITDDSIIGSEGPIVQFQDLRQITVMKADKAKHKPRAITLMVGKEGGRLSPIKFVAVNRDQRDEILLGIFGKLQPNKTNKRHWNTVMDAEEAVIVNIDHSEPKKQCKDIGWKRMR